MSGWERALEVAATRRGGALLCGIGVLTLALAAGLLRLEWTQDAEVITLEGSEELDFYRGYLDRWGSDELIVLAYEVPDAFDPAQLETLRSLTNELLDLEHVRRVWSLDTAFSVDTGPFGPYARPLVPDRISADPEIRERALSSPFVRDALVSADARTLILSVQLEGSELRDDAIQTRTLDSIDAILARPAYSALRPHLAGAPVFNREISRLNRRDNARFTPLAVAIVAGAAILLFRSVWASALVLGVVATTVIWTLGLMGWLRIPMNITTSLLPPLLLVIGVADSIHIATSYAERLRADGEPGAALRWTLREIVPSCFWTSATTALGFASLWLVRIESVRTFSTFAVVGVAVAFALSVTLLPALLVRTPAWGSAPRLPEVAWRSSRWARPRPRLAAGIALAAAFLAAVGIPRVEVATHDGEFFSDQNPLNRAYRFIESRLQGVTPFEIEVRAPVAGGLRHVPGIQAVAALQRRLPELPELTSGLSFVQLLETTSPDADLTRESEVERALFLLEALAPDDLGAWVDPSYRTARISARADAMTSARSAEVLDRVAALAADTFPPGWRVQATGLVPVFSRMEQVLVDGQLRSYGVAFFAIGAAFALVFRSLRVALIAQLANLVPILIAGGLMGIAGIRVDVATIMVASVALGLIVDDTIHLTRAYLRGLDRGAEPTAALRGAFAVAGRPIVLTSVILGAGFSVLALSDFQPTARFGTLIGVTIAAALLADLVILPAALVRLGRSRERAASIPRVEEATT